VKFLCLQCDEVMSFAERELPGDGTLTCVFTCAECGREMALLTNPMETQLVTSLGVEIGGRTVPEQPLEQTRESLDGLRADALGAPGPGAPEAVDGPEVPSASSEGPTHPHVKVAWSTDAQARLARVPSFVRGMVKRIYTEYAREHGISLVTPTVMDRARTDLGLEGM